MSMQTWRKKVNLLRSDQQWGPGSPAALIYRVTGGDISSRGVMSPNLPLTRRNTLWHLWHLHVISGVPVIS